MDLQGKLICFLGDSFTEGYGSTAEGRNYVSRVAAISGARCQGYGIGGTRYTHLDTVPADTEWNNQCFYNRVNDMDTAADVVVIFGGTNDFEHPDVPLGTMSDRTPNTFYGALHGTYTRALTRYARSEIVVVLPTHRQNEEAPQTDRYRHKGVPFSAFVQAIREVAEYYSLPVLELYAMGGLQPAIPANCERYFKPDGLHPIDAGYDRIAHRIVGFLQTL